MVGALDLLPWTVGLNDGDGNAAGMDGLYGFVIEVKDRPLRGAASAS